MRLLISGLVTGLGGGLASLGGGTLLIPLLTSWVGMDQLEARGTAMGAAIFSATIGSLLYGLHGSVDWRTLWLTGIPAMIVAPLAARFSDHWSQRLLRRLFGVVVLCGAVVLIFKDGSYTDFAAGWPVLWLILVGIIAGLVAGVVGVSGGPVLAPLFVFGLGVSQALAQGSSLLARIPQIFSSVWENHREGNVRWRTLPYLGAGMIAGTISGSLLALHLPDRKLRWIFAVLLFLLGLYQIFGPIHPSSAKLLEKPRSGDRS